MDYHTGKDSGRLVTKRLITDLARAAKNASGSERFVRLIRHISAVCKCAGGLSCLAEWVFKGDDFKTIINKRDNPIIDRIMGNKLTKTHETVLTAMADSSQWCAKDDMTDDDKVAIDLLEKECDKYGIECPSREDYDLSSNSPSL